MRRPKLCSHKSLQEKDGRIEKVISEKASTVEKTVFAASHGSEKLHYIDLVTNVNVNLAQDGIQKTADFESLALGETLSIPMITKQALNVACTKRLWKPFFNVVDQSSKKFCKQLLRCLNENRTKLLSYVKIFSCYEGLLKHARKFHRDEVGLETFWAEEHLFSLCLDI